MVQDQNLQQMFSLCPNPMMLQDLSMPSQPANKGMEVYLPRPDQPIAEFLFQLTKMLTVESKEIIEWANGRIKVHDPPRLEKEVLHKYFRHSKYASFQRQLNYFGFRKLAGKSKMSPCSYINDEASEELRSLLFIKRKTSSTAGKKAAPANPGKKSTGDAPASANGFNTSPKRQVHASTTNFDVASKRPRAMQSTHATSYVAGVPSAPLSQPQPVLSSYKDSNIVTDGETTKGFSSSSTIYSEDGAESINAVTSVHPYTVNTESHFIPTTPSLGEQFHFLSSNTLSALSKMNDKMSNTPHIEVGSHFNNLSTPPINSNNMSLNQQPNYIGVGPITTPSTVSAPPSQNVNQSFLDDIQNSEAFYFDPLSYMTSSTTIPTAMSPAQAPSNNYNQLIETSSNSNFAKNSSFASVAQLLGRGSSTTDFSNMTNNSQFLDGVEPTPLKDLSAQSQK